MRKPNNQNRTFHLLQKADILTCYEHGRVVGGVVGVVGS
jgi:hypothetical protein